MPAEVFSLHDGKGLKSVMPEKKRVLKYDKSAKRPVDANAPKKPLSAYFQWANDNRAKVSKKSKDLSVTELTKKLGEMWKNLPTDKKTKYEEKAKKEQATYKSLMACYKLTSDHQQFEKSLREYQIMMTLKPFRKDENAPKRALTAYMVFQKEKRPSIVEKNPDAKVTDIMGLCAAAWKALTDKQKEQFQKKSKKLAAQHEKEMAKYKNSKKHLEYLAAKKEYEDQMKAKRVKLEKAEAKLMAGAGSGASPKAKRRKTDAATTTEKPKPKKKTSNPKKPKKPEPKKKSAPKKKTSDPKKKKSAPKAKKASPKKKTSGTKQKKPGKSKKAARSPKRSVKKKARKAVAKTKKNKSSKK